MSNTAASLLVSLVSLGRSLRCFRTRYLFENSRPNFTSLVFRSTDVWLASTVEEVVLGSIGTLIVYPTLHLLCLVHADLLFAYRLLAFLFSVLVSLVHLKVKGIKPLRFYTKWYTFLHWLILDLCLT